MATEQQQLRDGLAAIVKNCDTLIKLCDLASSFVPGADFPQQQDIAAAKQWMLSNRQELQQLVDANS